MTLASPVGCVLSGYLLDQIGRKIVLQACLIPMFIGWIMLALSRSAKMMIIGKNKEDVMSIISEPMPDAELHINIEAY